MYNSRTKSTPLPCSAARKPQEFPATQYLLQYQKIERVLFPCACGRFIHFSHCVSVDAVPTSLTVQPPLHYVCFISPTSAPHSIGGLVAPFHNPRSHSITLPGCNPHSKIHTQTASKAPFHSPTPVSLHAESTHALFQRISSDLFFILR